MSYHKSRHNEIKSQIIKTQKNTRLTFNNSHNFFMGDVKKRTTTIKKKVNQRGLFFILFYTSFVFFVRVHWDGVE